MQRALAEINAENKRRHLPEFHMGIGINTGDAVVGNIGSMKRTQYTALGTPLNIAYRIESFTVGGQVLISDKTYERVKDVAKVVGMSALSFKGVKRPIRVYEVRGLVGKYLCEMPEKGAEIFFDLDPPLSIEFFILEGKTVLDKAIPGRIERLSENCAGGVLDRAVEENMNLKLRLAPNDAPISEIYARVLQSNPTRGNGATQIILNFTSVPDDARAFLEERRNAALGSQCSSGQIRVTSNSPARER
jgi:adenylate cyclase